MKNIFILSALICFLMFACDQTKESDQTKETNDSTVVNSGDENPEFEITTDTVYEGGEIMEPYDKQMFADYYGERVLPPVYNFEVDLKTKSLEELRYLRNEFFARKGYLFKDAVTRGYFNGKKWYQPPFWEVDYKIKLTQKEADFIEEIKKYESKLLKENYIGEGKNKKANFKNIVNLSQFKNLDEKLKAKLTENGFAIVENTNIQFFHIYEQNDYQLIPNFVTTDMFLQLFHMYFSYNLRVIEKDSFIPVLTELVSSLHKESESVYKSASANTKEVAAFNMCYYAIAYNLLTGEKLNVPAGYETYYDDETSKVMSAAGTGSEMLKDEEYSYSLFKPRGHYSRDEEFKSYFRTMIWLQTASMCLKDNNAVSNFVFTSWLLKNKKSSKGKSLFELYKNIFEPVVFLVGEPDNLSTLNILEILTSDYPSADISEVLKSDNVSAISKKLKEKLKTINKIKFKGVGADKMCLDLINFMPQRYLFDNEILLDMMIPDQRSYPKSLDVFATLGDKLAKEISIDENKNTKFKGYPELLAKEQKKFKGKVDWNKSVYNKWMESLNTMLKPDKNYPWFMQTKQWGKKNLNTVLASYAELKHDVILYAEQPMAAECGGMVPDQPVTPGYVEPNLNFWKKAKEMLTMTKKVFDENGLMSDDLNEKTNQIDEMLDFFIAVSTKEINGKHLSDQDFETIRIIGSTIEYLTLSLMEDNPTEWYFVQGPDRSVAVIADIFTNTLQKKCIEVATGYVNDIYVVVEINGLLYISKGGTFSFHEFLQDSDNRLTDEEWQQMLENKKATGIPAWMEEIMVPVKPLEVAPGFYYSSGC